MKKLLGILVLGLLWCNIALAEYIRAPDGTYVGGSTYIRTPDVKYC